MMIAVAGASSVQTSWSQFGFNLAFFVGLAAGFILGFFASLLANYYVLRYKKKKRGESPFYTVTSSGGIIHFEGQLPNTVANQNAIWKTVQRAGSDKWPSP